MALRVTARLAHRLGTIAPSQTPSWGNSGRADSDCTGAALTVKGQQCKAKWAVRAKVRPAKAAWNWGRVCSRCISIVTQAGYQQGAQLPTAADPNRQLDSQTLTAFGAACVDHGATTTGLHANQKAMGTGAADFGGLVSAFHSNLFSKPQTQSGQPAIIANFLNQGKALRGIWCVKH